MTEIRIGIIGLGGMSYSHMEHIDKLKDVRIIAVSDTNAEAIERAANRYNIPKVKQYSDYTDLIKDPEVDAVLSITPNDVHYEIVKCCLLHKKPFMTEKPFTRTFQEAYELNQLFDAEANQMPSMVGYSYRYIASFRYARDLIRQGKLGPIRHVFVQYLQSWGLPMYETPMNWRYSHEISGTGVLADLGTHMVDAARYLIGEFEEVSAMLKNLVPQRRDPNSNNMIPVDIDDFSGFLALLENDVAGVFQTSRNAYGSGNQLEVTIYGEKGTLSVSCENPEQLTWIHPNPEQDNPSNSVKELQKVPYEYVIGQMQDFFDMLRGNGRDGLPTLKDGYANQEVLEAIFQAAQAKRTIELADFRNKHLYAQGAN
ncbi:Gfo/Idh/MocA family protein [Cohnella sp.]|uniref:Gfo/Idh/MocA family protein n=1 Tax=Cohnella sp. TaxID=1883426 RepID=UPI0035654844